MAEKIYKLYYGDQVLDRYPLFRFDEEDSIRDELIFKYIIPDTIHLNYTDIPSKSSVLIIKYRLLNIYKNEFNSYDCSYLFNSAEIV